MGLLVFTPRNWKLCPHKNLHIDVYISFSHTCQNLEVTTMLFSRWTDKLWYIQANIQHLKKKISFLHEKTWRKQMNITKLKKPIWKGQVLLWLDTGSIPGLGRSPEEGIANHSSILDWRIPRREEPGGYCPQGRTESDRTEATWHTQHTIIYDPKHMTFWKRQNYGDNKRISSCQEWGAEAIGGCKITGGQISQSV